MKRLFKLILIIGVILLAVIINIKDSSAIPVFARKYKTSCSTCHIGFPARNAFGEAFRNNGYRFPEGEDEDMTKIKQSPLGSAGYKNVFPDAIFPADLPSFAPIAVFTKGELMEYRDNDSTNFKWGLPGEVEILFAATVGENISILGDYNPINDAAGFQLLWSLSDGAHLAFGDIGFTKLFTIISASSNGGGDSYAVAMPSPGSGVELRYASGDEGGYSFIIGFGGGDPDADGWTDSPVDTRYIRATYKIGGAGLLSGAGGTMGNGFIGLDNAVTLGANYFNSSNGVDGGEKNAFGGDITATYGSFRAIGQVAQWSDLEITQISAELDYFIYPWLVGVFRYEDYDENSRGYSSASIPGFAAFLRANAKLGAEYRITDVTEENILKVYAQMAF